ncbi:uncharacterized protein SCODWIG_00780 [Saccharomycodes ludwigii]|uniref:Uncharacterized protein n=1 Tax=Saccharomycodes ludwigii TaxID=36035 RepID=A0A376B354_9ASCO|nr:uncharacterized protein SCODWIG_00780 [Saccharomycodes ludwigii]
MPSLLNSRSFGSNNWCIKFETLSNNNNVNNLLVSLSNGECHVLDKNTLQSTTVAKVGNSTITGMINFANDNDMTNLFAVSCDKTVKIFDIRTPTKAEVVTTLNSNSPITALTYDHNILCYGTELVGADASIHMFHKKAFGGTPYRSFLDSHNADITCLKFHPQDPMIFSSGGTDGYCNIYDLTQEDEEDALHQVINFSSIHSCGFSSFNRIYALSHIETFAIYSLNDKSGQLNEKPAKEFGDLRKSLQCNYIVDLYPGLIVAGSNNNSIKLIPFDSETENFNTSKHIEIDNCQNGEVVRDIFIPVGNNSNNLIYTCGEDGFVNCWKDDRISSLKLPSSFWDYSENTEVFGNTVVEVDMDDDANPVEEKRRNITEETGIDKHKRKKKYDKKDKHKSKKYSRKDEDHRYKPY